MIGTVASTFKAFCLPSHYAWAAHDRRGIGLTYLFGMGWIVALVYFSAIEYYGSATGFDIKTLLTLYSQDQTNDNEIAIALLAFTSNTFILYITFGTLIAMGFALSLINIAIFYAIYAQVFNFIFNVKLDFAAVLRITVYTMITSLVVTIALLYSLAQIGLDSHDPLLGSIVLFIAFSCYSIMGILSAKYGYY
jgi:hypothetical protein